MKPLLSLLAAVILLISQSFVAANPEEGPYTFEELVGKGLINLQDDDDNEGKQSKNFKELSDPRLRFDYDFSLNRNEEIKIVGDNEDWCEEMSYALNQIKNIRTVQRNMYLKLLKSEERKNPVLAKMWRLQLIRDDNDILDFYERCYDLVSAQPELAKLNNI